MLFDINGNRLNGDAPIHIDVDALVTRDWKWQNLADAADLPAAIHLVNGLLIEGNITLLYSPVKTGKSRMLMGLLAAMSPGGPQFCGMDLKNTRTLLFTEEPPSVIGERVRDFSIPREANHFYNNAAALAMPPSDFAAEVYAAHERESKKHGNFGLIAVDTLGAFCANKDWNDYTATGAAMAPLRELARSLPNVAILLLHHQSKAGGADWAGALGSTALAGNVDQIVRMVKKGMVSAGTAELVQAGRGSKPALYKKSG